jgi:RND family efflux transporter MFP subunit
MNVATPSSLLLVALAGCARSAVASDNVPDARVARESAVPVEVVRVVSRPLETSVRLEAELSPWESVAVYPRVTGFVASIPVDRGSIVHRGQLLARLVAPELAAQRVEAEARVRGDRSTLTRLEAAARTPGVVAGHDVDLAEADTRADAARVRAVRDLEQYLVVTAPFEGVVTERNVHPGALVGPVTSGGGTPMLRIEQVSRLRVIVAVPESLASSVRLGATATFEVRAWPARRFVGTIARSSHAVEPRTRTMAVELDVDNADDALAPGMYAAVSWPIHRSTPSLFVPRTAIVQTTERTFVVRVRNAVAEPITIRRGEVVGDEVEVVGDLVAGDTVVRRGNEELREGTRVAPRVVPTGEPSR